MACDNTLHGVRQDFPVVATILSCFMDKITQSRDSKWFHVCKKLFICPKFVIKHSAMFMCHALAIGVNFA